ncbi:hypothetical protein [Nocardia crassostreae]|uniref:hypothetical protein n=1 Tax=Nocardia crassostreae TaxID=53428 RepID=UPI001FE20E45|nr:hypothetical protein [Nocardia crassostreae]
MLAAPVGRNTWLVGQLSVALLGSALVVAAGGFGVGLAYGLTISDLGQAARMLAVAGVYLPAVWVLVAVAALAYGWLPGSAPAAAWTVFAYCVIGLMFAEPFDLPERFDDASPFSHTPRAPLDSVAATPILSLLAVTALALTAAAMGFRRRDISN